jgi:hypothetical protein
MIFDVGITVLIGAVRQSNGRWGSGVACDSMLIGFSQGAGNTQSGKTGLWIFTDFGGRWYLLVLF